MRGFDFLKIKEKLLELTKEQTKELNDIIEDYNFYKGSVSNEELEEFRCDSKNRGKMLGQSWWDNASNLKYTPTQAINNITADLIKQQAGFFLGVNPTIQLKISGTKEMSKTQKEKNKEELELLREFIDTVLDSNSFWNNMLSLFELVTVTRRGMVRLEANPYEPIKLFFHDAGDFNYEIDKYNNLTKIVFANYIETNSEGIDIFIKYTYDLRKNEAGLVKCYLTHEWFKGNELETPFKKEEAIETIYNEIPASVFINNKTILEDRGNSDIKDIKDLQNQFNRRYSDFSDALRFQMFSSTAVIDGSTETVDNITIAPNSVVAIATQDAIEGKQAQVFKLESAFNNAEPTLAFLQLTKDNMYEKFSIPTKESLRNIPSAKYLKFLYNGLQARCERKWKDWDSGIFKIINLIIQSCAELNCYPEFKKEWCYLNYTMELFKNYPIPEDEEDNKKLAMEEVLNSVKSHKTYIKEFGSEEDYELEFKDILENNKLIASSKTDPVGQAMLQQLNEPDDL